MATPIKKKILVQSVARALTIINCFTNNSELGISELSDEMHLSKSTVFGLVNSLVQYGYLDQTVKHGKYKLGIRLFELGNLVLSRIDIRQEAKNYCAHLAHKYPATVHIATHIDGEVIYVDKIDNNNSLVTASNIGRRAPMYCTGVGKAMLAYLPEEYLKKFILSHPFIKKTKNTITSKERLLSELKEIRTTGIAVDKEEIELGLTCIASPVLDKDAYPELAISVSFPYGRIKDIKEEDVQKDLLACTQYLSERLGYAKKLRND